MFRDFTGFFLSVLEIWPLLKLKRIFFPSPHCGWFSRFFITIILVYRFYIYIYISLSNQFNSPIIITNNTNNVDRYLVIWSRFISLLPRCFDRNTFERIVVESGMARNRSQANKSSSFRDFVTAVATGRKFKQLFTFPIHEFRMARFV